MRGLFSILVCQIPFCLFSGSMRELQKQKYHSNIKSMKKSDLMPSRLKPIPIRTEQRTKEESGGAKIPLCHQES
jgi:hypothetical protein